MPGSSSDPTRWPDGTLPIHSTYEEWQDSQWNPNRPCQACHMPVHTEAGNGVDLGTKLDTEPGIVSGWYRPLGEVRRHTWLGPRHSDRSFSQSGIRP